MSILFLSLIRILVMIIIAIGFERACDERNWVRFFYNLVILILLLISIS